MASAEYHREWRKRQDPDKQRKTRLKYRSKPGVRERERAQQTERRRRNPARFISDLMKAVPCLDCGQRYPAMVMEFDHRDSTSKFSEVAVLVHKRSAPTVLFAEIAKCDPVCANCHRLRTLNRQLDKQG